MLINEFSSLRVLFTQYAFSYKDHVKKFRMNALRKTRYLWKGISESVRHQILYKLTQVSYTDGQVIGKPDEKADRLMILEEGEVEVWAKIQGDEFLLDRLYTGAVINIKSFLMEAKMHVTLRVKNFAELSVFSRKDFELI